MTDQQDISRYSINAAYAVCDKAATANWSKTHGGTTATNDDLLAALALWGSIAHDENDCFIKRFCPKAWILTQVSWDSENMRFAYILDCGQHVAHSVKITEWLEFLSAVNPIKKS